MGVWGGKGVRDLTDELRRYRLPSFRRLREKRVKALANGGKGGRGEERRVRLSQDWDSEFSGGKAKKKNREKHM